MNDKIKAITNQLISTMDKKGHAIKGISNGEHSYLYTIGLAIGHDIEFVSWCDLQHAEMVQRILNNLAIMLYEGRVKSGVVELTLMQHAGSEDAIRVSLMPIDVDVTIDRYTMDMGNPLLPTMRPDTIYLVIISDENNLLPGEKGYGQGTFRQHVPDGIL